MWTTAWTTLNFLWLVLLMSVNRFGLARKIPEAAKAEVRRLSKQGCVICRALAYDYEHIEPPFADAREHNPKHICLLCPSHHAEVTRGRLSKQQVFNAYQGVQTSEKVRPPMYRAQLTGSLQLGLGDALFEHSPTTAAVLRYDGLDVLKVGYVRDEIFGGSRPSITGIICDEDGDKLVTFTDNELSIANSQVDVKFRGTTLRVYKGSRKPALEVTFSPPDRIRITRLRFRFGEIVCEMDQTFGLTMPTGAGVRARFLLSGISAKGATAAINYCSDQSKWHPNGDSLRLVGGEGVWVGNTGATLAYKAGSMLLPRLEFIPLG